MSQFRMVILDNAKEQLDNNTAQKILSDTIFTKQKNFLRTDSNYVVTDKHDMIGTHYLIYDTSDFLNPKLIFAIRNTYLSRAKQHRIETPLMAVMSQLEESVQTAFLDFQKTSPDIADCNAWFVDLAFSKKNSGLNLSDLGYFMVGADIMRRGLDNMIGCTNETYHASRWVEKLGNIGYRYSFEHPAVKAPHKLMFLKGFDLNHFYNVYCKNKELIDNAYEVFPDSQNVVKMPQFLDQLFSQYFKGAEGETAA